MANTTYEVMTDLPPEALTELAAETFRKWLSFALGKSEIGGKVLAHPSGRYAASMSWKRTGEASIAIIADEGIAPEGDWIERGHAAFSMKDKMLANAKRSKDGYRYRVIPMRQVLAAGGPKFDFSSIVTSKIGERIPTGKAKMWAKARTSIGSDRLVTMSDKPGSSAWLVPAMPAYSPAAILSALIRRRYGTI